MLVYKFTAEIWAHHGEGAWYFMTLPKAYASEIREVVDTTAPGFGAIRVRVTIGSTQWQTSIFPDTKSGTYLLPVKKSVRTAESLAGGSVARAQIELDI